MFLPVIVILFGLLLPASAFGSGEIKDRIQSRLQDRYAYQGGIVATEADGRQSGIAIIYDRRIQRKIAAKIGQPLSSDKRFTLRKIHRNSIELSSFDFLLVIEQSTVPEASKFTTETSALAENDSKPELEHQHDSHKGSNNDADEGEDPAQLKAMPATEPTFIVTPSTTPEELKFSTVRLCASDARRLCDPSEPDPKETLICLQDNVRLLSIPCAGILTHAEGLDFTGK